MSSSVPIRRADSANVRSVDASSRSETQDAISSSLGGPLVCASGDGFVQVQHLRAGDYWDAVTVHIKVRWWPNFPDVFSAAPHVITELHNRAVKEVRAELTDHKGKNRRLAIIARDWIVV